MVANLITQKRGNQHGNAQMEKQVKQIFLKASNGKEVMTDEELFGFISSALQLRDDDPFYGHIFVMMMKIKKMEEVTFDEFKGLFLQSKTKSVAELKKKIGGLRNEAMHDKTYREMYKKIFDLYIGNHTTLDMDTAQQLWAVYLKPKLHFYKQFSEYLQSLEDKQTKKVHRDLWNMMLEFSIQVANIERDYNENDGWPVFIDNFVEYLKEKAQN